MREVSKSTTKDCKKFEVVIPLGLELNQQRTTAAMPHKFLIDNWPKVALKSHSMWSLYLGIAALWAPEALYRYLGYDVAAPQFWFLIAQVLLVYGIVGRLKYQGVEK